MNNNILTLNPPFILKNLVFANWKLSYKIFLILSILSVSILSIFYVFQVNAMVSEENSIQRYESGLKEITAGNQNLEMSLIQLNSLDNIIVLINEYNFEKADKIHYIRVLGNQVVTK